MNKDTENLIKDYLKDDYVLSESKNELYSIIIPALFSKKFFKSGSEIKDFLRKTVNITYDNYVFKSRTLIVSKIIKTINDMSLEESIELNKILLSEITKIIKNNLKTTSVNRNTNKKIKNKKSAFLNWIEYIENSK